MDGCRSDTKALRRRSIGRRRGGKAASTVDRRLRRQSHDDCLRIQQTLERSFVAFSKWSRSLTAQSLVTRPAGRALATSVAVARGRPWLTGYGCYAGKSRGLRALSRDDESLAKGRQCEQSASLMTSLMALRVALFVVVRWGCQSQQGNALHENMMAPKREITKY